MFDPMLLFDSFCHTSAGQQHLVSDCCGSLAIYRSDITHSSLTIPYMCRSFLVALVVFVLARFTRCGPVSITNRLVLVRRSVPVPVCLPCNFPPSYFRRTTLFVSPAVPVRVGVSLLSLTLCIKIHPAFDFMIFASKEC